MLCLFPSPGVLSICDAVVKYCWCLWCVQDLQDMTRIQQETQAKMERAMEQMIAAQTAKEHARQKVRLLRSSTIGRLTFNKQTNQDSVDSAGVASRGTAANLGCTAAFNQVETKWTFRAMHGTSHSCALCFADTCFVVHLTVLLYCLLAG